jgi:hydroxymethylpyrimidine pyrophosphatase-like HAD family hydrolase
VGPDLHLSDRITAVIGEATRRGVRVSLATGRMPSSAVVFATRLGLEEPVIGLQGAAIRAMPRPAPARATPLAARGTPAGRAGSLPDPDVPQLRGRIGTLLHHEPLHPDVAREALAWCEANGLDPHVNHLERILVQEGDPHFADYSAYLGKDAEVFPDLAAAITRPISKVISVGVPPRPMELIAEARRVFAGRASPTVSHPRFLEFVAPGVSKGRAVAWLARRARIPMGQVLTIGDALNDLEMIVAAGHGAAMATSPAELRLRSRYVAAPVEVDGAADLIEALVLASPAQAGRNAARLADEARAHRAELAGADAEPR